MRRSVPDVLEDCRIRTGEWGSDASYGMAGAFRLKGPQGEFMLVMSSGRDRKNRWEHVSVSTPGRAPGWDEMCFVKDMFWESEECVVQYHPPRSVYVNLHPHCLHLWKPLGLQLPMPPSLLVGPKLVVKND